MSLSMDDIAEITSLVNSILDGESKDISQLAEVTSLTGSELFYANTTPHSLAENNVAIIADNIKTFMTEGYTPLTGTGATGTWGINISGNAATASLATTVTTNANLTGDITSVGNATTYNNIVSGAKGGTGVANTGKTITLGGNLVTAGAFNTILTVSADSNATLPAGSTILVPTTGTGATGTWGISISGNAATASLATTVTTNANLTGDVISIGNATTYNSIVPGAKGGTGIANTGKTITLGGNLVTSGAFNTTLTVSADSNATLPVGSTILVPTTGTGATGTWGINISGNAATAFLATTVTTNANLIGDITSVGNATTYNNIVSPAKGGTGVNNGSSTLTLAGSASFIGAFTSAFTFTAPTAVTFPPSGTLATTAGLGSYLPLAGGTLTGDLQIDADLSVGYSNVGGIVTVELFNSATTGPASDVNLSLITQQAGGGDPNLIWALFGSPNVSYCAGIDNTDDTWKYCLGASLGTGTVFSVNNSTGIVNFEKDITNLSNYKFQPTTFATTMSQTGILATIVGMTSSLASAYVVPASGSAFTVVSYQGSTTVPTNVSQTIAPGTACTLYYFPNSLSLNSSLDAGTPGFGSIAALFSNVRYLGIGSASTSYFKAFNASLATLSVSASLPTAPNNSSNQTASQSGTLVTGVGTSWDSTYKGHMIRFATGSSAFIISVGSTTTMTVTPSQTVAATAFDIPGKTTGSEATSMDSFGNFGTNNAYINGSLTLPNGLFTTAAATTFAGAFATTITSTAVSNATLPSGTTVLVPTTGTGATGTWGISISGNAVTATSATSAGNASTVTTNANLTGDVTSSGNATTYNAIVPLPKGGTGANLTAVNGGLVYCGASALAIIAAGTAGQVYQSNGATAPTAVSTLSNAVQDNITRLNSGGNTLSINGTTKTFLAAAQTIGSELGPTPWTPAIALGGLTTGITYSFQSGFYSTTTLPNGSVKVHAWGSLGLSSKGSATGNLTITGFQVPTGANGTIYGAAMQQQNISAGAGLQLWISMNASASTAIVQSMGNGVAVANITNAALANNSVLIFNITYWTN